MSELDTLVEEIHKLLNTPEALTLEIAVSAENFALSTETKQDAKNQLIERLGLDIKHFSVHSAITTIIDNLTYLREIGVKKEDLGKVVTKYPQVLAHTVEDIVKPSVEYLLSLGVKQEDLGKIVTKYPQVLSYRIDSMKSRVEYLLSLGVKEKDLGKVVARHPQVLALSVEDSMMPHVEYLLSLGVKQEDLGKIVTKYPQVLVHSVEDTMKPKFAYLKEVLGGSVDTIIKLPAYFSYSLQERIKPRHEFLKLKGINAGVNSMLATSEENFCLKVVKCPLEEYQKFKEEYMKQNSK